MLAGAGVITFMVSSVGLTEAVWADRFDGSARVHRSALMACRKCPLPGTMTLLTGQKSQIEGHLLRASKP